MRLPVRRAVTASVVAALALGTAILTSPVAHAADAARDRVAGHDRYETSIALSKRAFAGRASTVFVASGEQFPDALAGGAAAAAKGAPLLLTRQAKVPEAVWAEIHRLQPSEIVVLGGSAVVGDSVVNDLALISKVSVIAGADRYDTAARIATTFFPTGSPAYLASGEQFPDALAGSSAAAKIPAPVLLTRSASLSPFTRGALDTLRTTDVRVLGGTAAVSEAVVDAVKPNRTVSRIQGADRYQTAVEVSKASFESAATVYLASGQNFPDALSGAALVAGKSPILLVRKDAPLPPTVCAEIGRLKATTVVALGGDGAITQDVLNAAAVCGNASVVTPPTTPTTPPVQPQPGCSTSIFDVTAATAGFAELVAGVREVDANINTDTGFGGTFGNLKSGADKLAAAGAPNVCRETLDAIRADVQIAYDNRADAAAARSAYGNARAKIVAALPSLNAALSTNHQI